MSFNYHALLSLNIQGRNAPPCPRSAVVRVCALRLNEWLLLNVGVSLRKACVGRCHEAVSFRRTTNCFSLCQSRPCFYLSSRAKRGDLNCWNVTRVKQYVMADCRTLATKLQGPEERQSRLTIHSRLLKNTWREVDLSLFLVGRD